MGAVCVAYPTDGMMYPPHRTDAMLAHTAQVVEVVGVLLFGLLCAVSNQIEKRGGDWESSQVLFQTFSSSFETSHPNGCPLQNDQTECACL